MYNVEIKVVNAPILELLLADRGHVFFIVERVPQLRNEEKIGAFDDAIFDRSSYSLAGFRLVTVVCEALAGG